MASGGKVWEVRFNGRWDNNAVKVGALGPSGPFGRYGPVEGGPGGGPGPGEGVGAGVAAVAAGEVEGYGGAGGGGGGPGGVGTPRIRVTALGGRCCAPLPVTQACNIGKKHANVLYLVVVIPSDLASGPHPARRHSHRTRMLLWREIKIGIWFES